MSAFVVFALLVSGVSNYWCHMSMTAIAWQVNAPRCSLGDQAKRISLRTSFGMFIGDGQDALLAHPERLDRA